MRKLVIFSPEIVKIILYICSIILCLIVLISRQYVPAKFLYDETTLKTFIATTQTCSLFDKANGYACTAFIYQIFNISLNMALILGSIIIPISFIILPFTKFIYTKIIVTRLIYMLLLAFLWGTIAAIFNSGLNKELLANFIILISLICIHKHKFILATVLIVIYGLYIRPYWIIVIMFTWTGYIIGKNFGPKWGFVAILSCLIIITIIAPFTFLHIPLSLIRSIINEERFGDEDAKSIIMPFFQASDSIFLEILNVSLIWISLVIPWPLFLMKGIFQILVSIIIPITIGMIIQAWVIAYQVQDYRSSFCCTLIFSFLAVQSIFEPDYGSFIRHLCSFMPFGLLAICQTKKINIK